MPVNRSGRVLPAALLGVLVVVALAALLLNRAPAPAPSSPVPLARAHAHNDYRHYRPLLDALGHGFTSVEADIWAVDGELLVAHELDQADPTRTLQALYLQPLWKRVQANDGQVHTDQSTFILLVDIKSDGESTYSALDLALQPYRPMLTTFTDAGLEVGAATLVVSGNRPRELMASQAERWAGYDGRIGDLASEAPVGFMPLISDHWATHFTWTGAGPMPAAERERLRRIIELAHEAERRVRFWGTPDDAPQRQAVWRELLAAGIDLINTDHLTELEEFLLANDPRPSTPFVDW
ncbi:MAG: phosphatidylinositol-specific phospholipase C/glycerophosphodiester phosphodiesterase family protein [Acidimicrobiia bacterium]